MNLLGGNIGVSPRAAIMNSFEVHDTSLEYGSDPHVGCASHRMEAELSMKARKVCVAPNQDRKVASETIVWNSSTKGQ